MPNTALDSVLRCGVFYRIHDYDINPTNTILSYRASALALTPDPADAATCVSGTLLSRSCVRFHLLLCALPAFATSVGVQLESRKTFVLGILGAWRHVAVACCSKGQRPVFVLRPLRKDRQTKSNTTPQHGASACGARRYRRSRPSTLEASSLVGYPRRT